ncbi:Dynein assembly factor with WDR repeat domains 1 [Phlyctochytrium planicorne]|nr:Dynein assembly factor with WDR repeat domains 1 [Phlyctochytrium planicorne]
MEIEELERNRQAELLLKNPSPRKDIGSPLMSDVENLRITADVKKPVFKATRVCRLAVKVTCVESLGDTLLIGTLEGLYCFDTSSQDAKIVPLSSRPFVQLQYLEHLGAIVSRSGKHDIVSTHEYFAGTKFGRKQKFEVETKVKKIKETKGSTFFSIASLRDSAYLCVALPETILILKWAQHPYSRFMKEKTILCDFIPKSVDMHDSGNGNHRIWAGGMTDFSIFDAQKNTWEKYERLKSQDFRYGAPVRMVSFANSYVLCYESIIIETKEVNEVHSRTVDILDLTPTSDSWEIAKRLVREEKIASESRVETICSLVQRLKKKISQTSPSIYHLNRKVYTHALPITNFAINKDGSRLITASYDRSCKIWDSKTGKELASLSGHQNVVYSVALNHPFGDKVATGSFDKTSRGHSKEIIGVSFSNYNDMLVTGSLDSTANVWDLRMTRNGQDKTARVYDSSDFSCKLVLKGHEDEVVKGSFTPRGDRIITTSRDKTVRVWDAFDGNCIQVLDQHSDEAFGAACSYDGDVIITGSKDNTCNNLNNLLSSFSDAFDPNRPSGEASSILRQIFEQNEEIQKLIADAEEHVKRQNQIRKVQSDVYTCNASILTLLRQLKDAENKLENMLKTAEDRRKAVEQTKQKRIDYESILSYGRRLAKYTSPPPPGLPINYPPIPQDAHMRRSLLFAPEASQEAVLQTEQDIQPQVLLEMDMSKISAVAETAPHAEEEEQDLLDLDL